jgi:hypothetical protein
MYPQPFAKEKTVPRESKAYKLERVVLLKTIVTDLVNV